MSDDGVDWYWDTYPCHHMDLQCYDEVACSGIDFDCYIPGQPCNDDSDCYSEFCARDTSGLPTACCQPGQCWDESGIYNPETGDVSGICINQLGLDSNNELKCLNELFIYVPKDKRGGRDVLKAIRYLEAKAKETECKRVRVGANYGLNDNKFVSLLERLGYRSDVLFKEI